MGRVRKMVSDARDGSEVERRGWVVTVKREAKTQSVSERSTNATEGSEERQLRADASFIKIMMATSADAMQMLR